MEFETAEIREATMADFQGMMKLFRQLWPSRPLSEHKLRELFLRIQATPGRRFFCAILHGNLVGLGSISIRDRLLDEGKIAAVDELVVDESVRGRRIGTQLMHFLTDFATQNGCRAMELEAANHRAEAHQFYEKLGFQRRAQLFTRPLS